MYNEKIEYKVIIILESNIIEFVIKRDSLTIKLKTRLNSEIFRILLPSLHNCIN